MMGAIRHSTCLLLILGLMVSACGRGKPTPAVAMTSSPVRVLPTPKETAGVAPRPEVQPTQVQLSVKPPPEPPRVPPAPPSRSDVQSAGEEKRPPPPTLSPQTSYPKAKSSASAVGQAPSFSLETSYPKADRTGSPVEEAEAASLALDRLIASGQLQTAFYGTGHPQAMVHFLVINQSERPVKVRLVPGMILNPGPGPQVQPLLVTEQVDAVLQPGESQAGSLLSFCMDSRVPAPLPGQPVDYRFSTRTKDGGPQAVRAYSAAEKLAKSSPYKHAIIQIAIWKSLNQPVEDKHFQSVLGASAADPRVRQEVLRQVDQVLLSLKKSSP